MTQNFATAKDVSETLLEITGRAILTDDFSTFLPCFRLPTDVETFEGIRRLRAPEEIEQVFRAVLAHHRRIGVTDMERHCVEASFTDATTVVAMHETRLMSGNFLIQRPYPTLSVIMFDEMGWRIASSSYAIEDKKEHNLALLAAGEALSTRMVSDDST